MRNMHKSIWCLFLAAAFLLILLPLQASAATTTTHYVDYDGTLYSDVTATVIEASTTNWDTGRYVVDSNVSIDGFINVSGDVELILADDCKLETTNSILLNDDTSLTIYGQENNSGQLVAVVPEAAYTDYPGIGIGNNSTITINGGIVKATGGNRGAGIGTGHYSSNSITIAINGGTVEANGRSYGAGIGAGNTNYGNVTIIIKGGTITATSYSGAGIGAGSHNNRNIYITIEGGTITATGGSGADIGKGAGDSANVTTNITGGTVTAFKYNPAPTGSGVHSTKITLQNVKVSTSITSVTIGDVRYNPGLSTNANGEFSLWLTTGTEVTQVEAGGQVYQGSVLAGSEGTLDDITAPTVQNVTPNGSDVARSGNIVIQFSEEMDSTPGTVSLDNGIGDLQAGIWNDQKTYTIPTRDWSTIPSTP